MKILTEEANLVPAFPVESLAPEEEILFFDIETTGLRKETTQVYLIGCAFLEEGEWRIRQFLAESALDEREILEAFADFASGFSALIHFNGDGFDIPYLAYKAEYYGLPLRLDAFESYDIYKMAKPLKKLLGLQSLKQKAVERFLGISREDLYGGGALIPVYYEYERSRDPEAERLLLLHNLEDVKGMLEIIKILHYTGIAEGQFLFKSLEIFGDTAVFEYRLEQAVPVGFERPLADGNILFCADRDLLQLNIRIYEGQARLPLPDIENYYYLPEEDRVIHRDVAQFVDRACRKKATKKNCFLKKEGRFLPQKKELFSPAFQVEGIKKLSFFALEGAAAAGPEILAEYALDIMNL